MMPAGNLVRRTLLAVARQRDGLDESRCQLVVEFLAAGRALHGALSQRLAELGFTDHQFSVLVALFALDPAAATSADLAIHAGATRSAMTAVLDALEARGLVARRRDTRDRRLVYVRLTPGGQEAANSALMQYLGLADRLAQLVDPAARPSLLEGFAHLRAAATRLALAAEPSLST